jgi:ZIP family zinc transporter
LVTGVGALITLAVKRPSEKMVSFALGFASGIMIGISTLSLIPEGLALGNLYTNMMGFITGALFLWLVDMFVPHTHKSETGSRTCSEKDSEIYKKMGYFIALGIAVHNLPEGIAIGVTHEVSVELGASTALSIALHNIAEGMSVAFPLYLSQNVGKIRVVFITTMTGLATLLGTIIGLSLVSVSPMIISFSLAFAAGAMIYIASDELIPQSHSVHSHAANLGIITGILMATVL